MVLDAYASNIHLQEIQYWFHSLETGDFAQLMFLTQENTER
jgi:hypothetical protein